MNRLVSLFVVTSAFAWFAVSAASARNLIRNPSFEDVPGVGGGQGILPNDWIPLNQTPDTWHTALSGGYGLQAGAFGSFGGVAAYDGIHWISGWTFNGDPTRESFGQVLTNPLTPGENYELSAYLHSDTRPSQSDPGAYEIRLWDLVNGPGPALGTWAPVNSPADGWVYRSIAFTAPANAANWPILAFVPYHIGSLSSNPGCDLVSLVVVPTPGSLAILAAGAILLNRRRRNS